VIIPFSTSLIAMSSLVPSPSRLLGGALPAAFALCAVLLSGGQVDASCGDWLEGHVPAGSHAADWGGPASDLTPLRPPGQRPCNGPSCGRAPHVPHAPYETPTVPLDLERDAILAHGAPDPIPGTTRMTAIEEPLLPSALRGRPERPPRTV